MANLYFVPTPIESYEDMTIRGVDIIPDRRLFRGRDSGRRDKVKAFGDRQGYSGLNARF